MAQEIARPGILNKGAHVVGSIAEQINQHTVEQWVSQQPVAISPDVLQFLEAHVFLLPVLDEAQNAISKYFGPASITYEMFHDPEDGVTTKLALSVNPQSAPPDAARQYRELTKGWWVSALARARGALAIVVEYR